MGGMEFQVLILSVVIYLIFENYKPTINKS
jgi:hypothetical protein